MWKIVLVLVVAWHFFPISSKENGSFSISLISEECSDVETFNPYTSLINWTANRVNELNLTQFPLEISTFTVCTELDYYDTIYEIFRENPLTNFGVIFTNQIPLNIEAFLNVLKIKYVSLKNRYWWHMENLIKATIKTLLSLKLKNNVILLYDKWIKADTFFKVGKKFNICVTSAVPFDKYERTKLNSNNVLVIIKENVQIITNEAEETFVIETFNEDQEDFNQTFLSPILFDICTPVLSFILETPLTETEILQQLQIDNSPQQFSYNTYCRNQNGTVSKKVESYGVFESLDHLNAEDIDDEDCARKEQCEEKCINFQLPKRFYYTPEIHLRNEGWIFAFLTISSLGIVFCLAIAVFFTVRFIRRDVFEGNPTMSLLLLLAVIFIYSAIVPFCLTSPDKHLQHLICLARGLTSTLCYAFCFSILLSRSILLATVSKEVGFMSHIPGPVQGFLTIFIFAVQGALSLQFAGYCGDIFRGISFLYLMSYNIILLLLLICVCPLNAKSRRNYKEGKYFTIAVFLMGFVWSLWITGYVLCEETWKDAIICIGLVSSASVILCAIFIPRTYTMTIAIERDKITNALPSLHASNSIIDVYRASTQPVYDCINVAAINAASIATNFIPAPPSLPPQNHVEQGHYGEEFDSDMGDTPSGLPSPVTDKVTRF